MALALKAGLEVMLLLLAFLVGAGGQHLLGLCIAIARYGAVCDTDVKDGGGTTAPEAVA